MSIYFQQSFARAFGTFPLKVMELDSAVQLALSTGYRAFDTAQFYGNEQQLGESLSNSGVARDELLITTKVSNDNFTQEQFLPSVETSLKKLDSGPIDVLLLHWPPADGNVEPSLRLLQQAQTEGLAKHIGVSNYTASMMHVAAKIIDGPVVTNQVEFHPLLDQSTLLAASTATGIPLSSYCSVARGKALINNVIIDIADAHNKTPAQVTLRWILQKGVSINTMSTKAAHIDANFNITDFTLSAIDMAKIDKLGSQNYRIVNKSIVPWAPDWD